MATYPTVLAGQDITADLLNSMLPRIAWKTVSETVTSSTTLQNDNELFVPLEANATYFVHLFLLHDSDATAAGDIKFGWAALSGATMQFGVHGANTSVTSSTGVTSVNMQSRAFNEVAAFGGGDSAGTAAFAEGIIITAGTSGNLQLQWAQETSNAVATTVRVGSYLSARRLA